MILRAVIVFFVIVIVGVAMLTGREGSSSEKNSPIEAVVPAFDCANSDESSGFPSGTKVMLDDPHGKGWRQTGMMPIDVNDAMRWLAGYMRTRGFYRTHNVEQGNRMLSEWTDGNGNKLMWMFWPANGKTGFSWGEVK